MRIDRTRVFALACLSFWIAILIGGSFGGRMAAVSCLAVVGGLLWPAQASKWSKRTQQVKLSILMAGGVAVLSLFVLSTGPSTGVVFSALLLGLLGLPWVLLSFWGVVEGSEQSTETSSTLSQKDLG